MLYSIHSTVSISILAGHRGGVRGSPAVGALAESEADVLRQDEGADVPPDGAQRRGDAHLGGRHLHGGRGLSAVSAHLKKIIFVASIITIHSYNILCNNDFLLIEYLICPPRFPSHHRGLSYFRLFIFISLFLFGSCAVLLSIKRTNHH